MRDGYALPARHWPATGSTRAVVLALHGFNDYSNFFTPTATALGTRGIDSWAIDQRGFGASAQAGLWAGHTRMQDDLLAVVELLCERYPAVPLYLFGESMGGAVLLASGARLADSCARGLILSAPAVWGWRTMPWYQRAALWLGAHTLPGQTVTGEGLDIRPSDNIDMLRALGRDPLVIKATRIDAIYGLTNLMQLAADSGDGQRLPILMLYGEQDEIITPVPTCALLAGLGDFTAQGWQVLLYPDGFHMLTRDLQGHTVIDDVARWIRSARRELPTARRVLPGDARLQVLCH